MTTTTAAPTTTTPTANPSPMMDMVSAFKGLKDLMTPPKRWSVGEFIGDMEGTTQGAPKFDELVELPVDNTNTGKFPISDGAGSQFFVKCFKHPETGTLYGIHPNSSVVEYGQKYTITAEDGQATPTSKIRVMALYTLVGA